MRISDWKFRRVLFRSKTWRATLSWEHRFGEDAALTLGWTHDRIDDVVDRVLVVTDDNVFDAPGNIGRGRRDTLSLDLAAPLDAWGIANGRIRTTVLWRSSSVTDPVTGRERGRSEEHTSELQSLMRISYAVFCLKKKKKSLNPGT